LDREGFKVIQGFPLDRVEEALYSLLSYYIESKKEGESFAEFAHRVGADNLKAVLLNLIHEVKL